MNMKMELIIGVNRYNTSTSLSMNDTSSDSNHTPMASLGSMPNPIINP